MILTHKKIKAIFPSGRINLVKDYSMDICNVIPYDDKNDKYIDINLEEFLQRVLITAYDEGFCNGQTDITNGFKKLMKLK